MLLCRLNFVDDLRITAHLHACLHNVHCSLYAHIGIRISTNAENFETRKFNRAICPYDLNDFGWWRHCKCIYCSTQIYSSTLQIDRSTKYILIRTKSTRYEVSLHPGIAIYCIQVLIFTVSSPRIIARDLNAGRKFMFIYMLYGVPTPTYVFLYLRLI